MDEPSPALQHVANFRDVGRTVNAYLGERCLTPNHSRRTLSGLSNSADVSAKVSSFDRLD